MRRMNLAFIFGMGVIFFQTVLFAAESPAHSPSAIKEVAKEKVQEEKASQKQNEEMAAWMIEAGQVAKNYVEGLDKGEYSASWNKGDVLFQRTISQQEWTTALNLARKRLGNVQSRTLKDQRPAWDPVGLPKGPYMVVEYNTSFDAAPGSGELLTLRRGGDGHWRVLTYQVN
ncbi:MAG: DUF4019 domain-containing protein [Candidatus Protochlamydia sp.]|nr:DUF4019 domain-containing protein [Candidatus Protochlamydia sp.]